MHSKNSVSFLFIAIQLCSVSSESEAAWIRALWHKKTPAVLQEEQKQTAYDLVQMDRDRCLENQLPQRKFTVDRFFRIHGADRTLGSNTIAKEYLIDDGSHALLQLRSFVGEHLGFLPKQVRWLIASYLQGTKISLEWNNAMHHITVPCSVPGSGLYMIDLRCAIGKEIGIPPYLVRGAYHQMRYEKPLDLIHYENPQSDHRLGYKDDLIVLGPKPWWLWRYQREDAHRKKIRTITTFTYKDDEILSKHVKLNEATGDASIMLPALCTCRPRLCKKAAFLYVVSGSVDPVIFCAAGKDFENLTKILYKAFRTRYKAVPVEFLCRDCSKTFHPKWIMANFFASDSEVSAYFEKTHCGCYKRKRTWTHSMLARIIPSGDDSEDDF